MSEKSLFDNKYLDLNKEHHIMKNIEIGRPKIEDTELINEFFQIVIKDTFEKNDISHLVDLIEEEIEYKRNCLNQDFESEGKSMYFLIAKEEEKIVGSIAYGPANDLINICTKDELKGVVEIGTVFVHPKYQQKGIGAKLINQMFIEFEKKGIEEFCLDSGYKTAQRIWIKRFGNPQYLMKDYWGKDDDHMIWRLKLKDVLH